MYIYLIVAIIVIVGIYYLTTRNSSSSSSSPSSPVPTLPITITPAAASLLSMNSAQSPQIAITPAAASMLGVNSIQTPQITITPAAANMIDMNVKSNDISGNLFGVRQASFSTPSPQITNTPAMNMIDMNVKSNDISADISGNLFGSSRQAFDISIKSPSRITNNFSKSPLGDPLCLDIINDGQNNKLIMSPCGNYYSGQEWTYQNNKLQNLGRNLCLDIINDGQNNKLIMSPCGNYSGQQWNIS